MSITATELKNNLGKYLALAEKEDIYITKNKKTVAKLVSTEKEKLKIVESLYGCIPDTITLEEAREERLSKI